MLSGLLVELASAQGFAAEAQKADRIVSLTIEGESSITEKEIAKVMLTRPAGLAFWRQVPFDRKTLDADLDRIRQLYQSKGFYDTRITLIVDDTGRDGALSVKLLIQEGEPVLVASLEVNPPLLWPPGLETLPAFLPLKVGDVFTNAAYNAAKKMLFDSFADHGYARVEVEGQARIYRQERHADVSFVVQPGKQARVSDIFIIGTERVSPDIVSREMALKAGDLYSLVKITNDQAKLYDLDLFRTVGIKTIYFENDPEQVRLEVFVDEKPAREVKLGVGYGSEDLLRLRTELRWRNFLQRGYTLQLTGKYSALVGAIESKFNNPYFLGHKNLALSHQAGLESEDLESYANTRYFSRIELGKKWSPSLSQFISFNIETNSTGSLSAAATDESLRKYGRREVADFILSSLEAGIKFDTVDDYLEPGKGILLSYRIEPALSWLGSEIDFVRHVFELKGFRQIRREDFFPGQAVDKGGPPRQHGAAAKERNIVLAARTLVGTVDPTLNNEYVPISKRFFCGGSNSVRGYRYQELGAMDAAGNPTGGYSLLEASAEMRFPLLSDLKGVAFFDTGNVFADSFSFDLKALRYSAGLGLRYHTLVGPIRFDIAYQLNPQSPEEGSRYRLHLNLGEAF